MQKFATVLLILALNHLSVNAQDDGFTGGTTTLEDLDGENGIASGSGEVSTKLETDKDGSLNILHQIQVKKPQPQHVVQSHVVLKGAADNGQDNVYAITNAAYASNVQTQATVFKTKRCGNVSNMDQPGSQTTMDQLTFAGCSLGVKQTLTHDTQKQVFKHEVAADVAPKEKSGYLAMGQSLEVGMGLNLYQNAASQAPIVEKTKVRLVQVKLDGAVQIGTASVCALAAALTLTSF